jgi:hypothetical protein
MISRKVMCMKLACLGFVASWATDGARMGRADVPGRAFQASFRDSTLNGFPTNSRGRIK